MGSKTSFAVLLLGALWAPVVAAAPSGRAVCSHPSHGNLSANADGVRGEWQGRCINLNHIQDQRHWAEGQAHVKANPGHIVAVREYGNPDCRR
jgi:hypothetical protein